MQTKSPTFWPPTPRFIKSAWSLTFRVKDSIEVIVGAMSFEKPMSLALGPLPLWFLALWANFGCVVLTSFTVKSTDEFQECPKVRIWPLPAFFRQSIFSCSELTWSNTQQNALPETNISPLKIGLPKRELVFQPSIFRCKVSFSEAKKKTPSACWSTWPSRVSLRPFVFFFRGFMCTSGCYLWTVGISQWWTLWSLEGTWKVGGLNLADGRLVVGLW